MIIKIRKCVRVHSRPQSLQALLTAGGWVRGRLRGTGSSGDENGSSLHCQACVNYHATNGNYTRSRQFDSTLPRWRPHPEIAWHPDPNSMRSPSSNAINFLHGFKLTGCLFFSQVIKKMTCMNACEIE